MSRFDDDLRQALRRREPREGFADRVLARVPEVQEPAHKPLYAWRGLAVAAAVLLVTIGLALYSVHLRRIQGERAKQQVLFALRVTGTRLRVVQERVIAVQQRTIELPADRN